MAISFVIRVSVLIAQEDTLQSCMSDEAMVTESDAHEYGLQQVSKESVTLFNVVLGSAPVEWEGAMHKV